MSPKIPIGRRAELIIEEELRRQSWQVLATNFRCIGSEIDIICHKGQTLAFVEVKARTLPKVNVNASRFCFNWSELLPRSKQKALFQGASHFLSCNHTKQIPAYTTARFDLAVVFFEKNALEPTYQMTYYPAAFSPI